MIDIPQILVTDPRHYAFRHLTCPLSDIQKVMGPAVQEVLAAVLNAGLHPTGPWFTHHRHRPVETFDFEVCFPIPTPMQPNGHVHPGIWPAMKVARATYHGAYSGLSAAWAELDRWVNTHSRHPGTQFWEVYTVNPHDDPKPENWRTELNWPLLD